MTLQTSGMGRIFAALVLVAGAAAPSSSESADVETWSLEPGRAVDREIDGASPHGYSMRLGVDDFLDLRVDQEGVDVAAALLGPDGTIVRKVDTPTDDRGPEFLWWVAAEEGEYRLEIRFGEASGRYRMTMAPLRPADDDDVLRATAQGHYLRGQRHARRRPDLARAAFGDALVLWRRLQDPFQEVLALAELGRLAVRANALDDAVTHYREGLRIVADLDAPGQRVRLLNLLGRAYRLQAKLGEAATRYRAALDLAEEIGHRHGEAVAANNLAVLYYLRGEAERALSLYERARDLFRRGGNERDEAATLRSLSRCYLLLDRIDDALAVLQELLELPLTRDDASLRARTLATIGWFHHQQGDPERALIDYAEALRLYESNEPDSFVAGTLDRRGTALASLGRWREAEESYREALELFHRGGYLLAEGHTLSNLCRLYDLSGQPEKGLDSCRRSLAIVREVGDANAEAFVLYLSARIERRLGDPRPAVARMAETLDVVDRLRAAAGSRSIKTSFFADRLRFYAFYVDLLMELHRRQPDSGWDVRALEVHERGRARSLVELLAEAGAGVRARADAALLERQRWLAARIEEVEQERRELEETGASAARLDAAHRELRQLLREHDDLELEILRASPEYAALVRPQPISMAEIQELLDGETLLLVYALGEDRSFLWCVGRSELTSHELPSKAEIEAEARAYYRLLSDPRRQVAAKGQRVAIGRELSELLLAPAAARLDDRRLVILGDGALHYLPFGALPSPKDGGADPRPIVADHEVLALPSASALALLRRGHAERAPAPGLLAVVADPVLDARDGRAGGGRLRRLPHAEREARDVLALAGDAPTLLITGSDATRERVLSGELGRYRIIHFATHGVIDAVHPQLSGLALSAVGERGEPRASFLRFHEIFNLDLPAELAVLSACETALGPEIRGEGMVGLTRAFYYAGVPRVMVSLWKIEDEATTELMRRFYEKLLGAGLAPGAALRAAQKSMWREWPPYYWAGMVLQGDWRGFVAGPG